LLKTLATPPMLWEPVDPKMKPPRPKKIPHDVSAHGIHRVDDYFWLRDRDNPDVISHLEA